MKHESDILYPPSRDTWLGELALILSPSAAGKSTFVVANPDQRFVDGDGIVSNTIGWPDNPPGTRWWQVPELNAHVQARNWMCIQGFARLTQTIVVFNGAIVDTRKVVAAVVLPPLCDHMRNMAARQSKRPWSYPQTVDDLHENRGWTQATADANGWPVFDTFQAAAADVLARLPQSWQARPLPARWMKNKENIK